MHVGVAAPALAYGALNSLLYMTYNRSLRLLEASISDPTKLSKVALWKIGAAGAAGGLATWVISAPSELVKCRAQLQTKSGANSLTVFKEIWTEGRMRAIYHGGLVTSTRDAIGYAFYFSSYEVCKRLLSNDKMDQELQCTDTDVLLSGGIAGVTTWASIYPLDVIKTRIQTADLKRSPHIISLTRTVYRTERPQAFFRGLTVCSIRAFIVNAIQVKVTSNLAFLPLTYTSGSFMRRQWQFLPPNSK